MTLREANLYVAKHYKRNYGFVAEILESVFGSKKGSGDGAGMSFPGTVVEEDVVDDPFPEGFEVIRVEGE